MPVIIFAGAFGRFPIGGHAWTEMHYLLGLRDLGFTVYFIEDCGEESWVYHWEKEELTTDLDYPVSYLRDCLDQIGMQGQWVYRTNTHRAGMSEKDFRDVCAEAELLIIRSLSVPVWRTEYDLPRRRIFIDSDPGFTQFKIANGDPHLTRTVAKCELLFTVGQRITKEDCPIPTLGREWLTTVHPIVLRYWPVVGDHRASHFTTIMQWKSYESVDFAGITYKNKDAEIWKFIDIPQSTTQRFRIGLLGGSKQTLVDHGWEVVSGLSVSCYLANIVAFIHYIRRHYFR